MPADF